jgi:hypothetical protein
MAQEQLAIDIDGMPELARLADEVQRTGQPRVLSRNNSAVAILLPATRVSNRRPLRAPRDPIGVVERTAGIFRAAAKTPPATLAAEKAAFEEGVAEEVMGLAEG